MGVIGIVPFLLKKCPEVIEVIPSRFQALKGKTIAIDGTLITQRMHYTVDPRPYKHILGWYQLVYELRQHDIKVICVFDGKHRIPAKLEEVIRRRRLRLEAQARAAWERSRHQRLISLTEVLKDVESLPEDEQAMVLENLKKQQDDELQQKDEQADIGPTLDCFGAGDRQESISQLAAELLTKYHTSATQSAAGGTPGLDSGLSVNQDPSHLEKIVLQTVPDETSASLTEYLSTSLSPADQAEHILASQDRATLLQGEAPLTEAPTSEIPRGDEPSAGDKRVGIGLELSQREALNRLVGELASKEHVALNRYPQGPDGSAPDDTDAIGDGLSVSQHSPEDEKFVRQATSNVRDKAVAADISPAQRLHSIEDLPPTDQKISNEAPAENKTISQSLDDNIASHQRVPSTKEELAPTPQGPFKLPTDGHAIASLLSAECSAFYEVIPGTSVQSPTSQDVSSDAQLSEFPFRRTPITNIRDEEGEALMNQNVEPNTTSRTNDNQHLSKLIHHLHEHYTSTSTAAADGLIHALSEGSDTEALPDIPISRNQLKYTQEEGQLWEQLVQTSGDTKIDLARVVEQAQHLASMKLPKDYLEPETEAEPEVVAEQEPGQATELLVEGSKTEEVLPISEWAATLEEQSGMMVSSLARRSNPPSSLTYSESRLILEAMGVPCIESPMNYEAEALASSLVINQLADFVGSEDTDVLIYNAPLLRHLTNRKVPLQVIPPATEAGLGLSRSAFVDAALLMGTDFVKRLKKIGPNTAYRLMHKYGSIERMLEAEPKFRPLDIAEYLEKVKVARLIFNSLPPTPPPESIAQGDWNEHAIRETMAHFGLKKHMEEIEQLIPDALSDNYFSEESKNFS